MYKSYLSPPGAGGNEAGGGEKRGGAPGGNYSTLAPRVVERKRGEERTHSFRAHTIRNIAQCQHCQKV